MKIRCHTQKQMVLAIEGDNNKDSVRVFGGFRRYQNTVSFPFPTILGVDLPYSLLFQVLLGMVDKRHGTHGGAGIHQLTAWRGRFVSPATQ